MFAGLSRNWAMPANSTISSSFVTRSCCFTMLRPAEVAALPKKVQGKLAG
jgi:hypothetical protein